MRITDIIQYTNTAPIDEPSPKDILNLEPTQQYYQSRKYKFHVNKKIIKKNYLQDYHPKKKKK